MYRPALSLVDFFCPAKASTSTWCRAGQAKKGQAEMVMGIGRDNHWNE